MNPQEAALRQAMVETSRQLLALGLNRGTSGNVGVRCGDALLVTPSGVPVPELTAEGMVLLDFDGNVLAGERPSSEWRFHRDILAAREDVHAVVHTHAPFSTTLACLRRGVPAFHYMIAAAGGNDIRCAPYALFGTQALSNQALAALEGRKACLLANHGMLAVGRDLQSALALAVEVESLCEQYWRALQIGAPHLLDDAEMDAVIEKFKDYGPRRPAQP
ncbi:MAG: class II aldolase/adducin family protein [Pseudomonadota bacterium]